jgi:glycosyltransferase involved in cell wall biosynthesis
MDNVVVETGGHVVVECQPPQTSPFISVVVPVYNEAGAIAELYREILDVCRGMGSGKWGVGSGPTGSGPTDLRTYGPTDFEIIFVNDGSSDSTMDVLKTLSPLKIINLRRNFGQTAAMDAGIKASRGRYIATLDGDGQNDPADIPLLIAKLERDGLDVVNGWRKNRKDTFMKRAMSRSAAQVRKFLINDGIHDSGCSLKVYKRECFERVNLYGEMHRFIPALLKIKGFRIGEEIVNHRPRTTGKTKYNWKRGLKGILDMIAVAFWQKYASRPLHLFGGIGVLMMLVSGIAGLMAMYKKIFAHQDLSNSAMTELSMLGFFIGIMFFVFGLISDILVRTYFQSTADRWYDVKETIDRA